MSDVIQVSPRFKVNRKNWEITSTRLGEGPFEFYDKTAARLIYQDRMQGWFFDPVHMLIENYQTVVAVHIVTPLIEALENYIRGESSRRNSGDFFKSRAKVIFPCLDDTTVDLLYKGVRCGFAHEGFLKDDEQKYNILIALEGTDSPIIYKYPEMTIYTRQYVNEIQDEFKKYYSQLENDEAELDKFFRVWKKQWDMKGPTRIELSGTHSN
jgi:hypothetical protein